MFKSLRNLKPLILHYGADAQLELVGQGLLLPADLKKLRRRCKNLTVLLQVDIALVAVHKVYLDEKFAGAQNLAYRLWQELDIDEFGFDEIFYDYFELESSLPQHLAYQFVFVRKARLRSLLNAIKRSGFLLKRISILDYPNLNLLPWRERQGRREFTQQLLRLGLLPVLLVVGLMLFDQHLVARNQKLSQQLAQIYQQGLDQQVGHALLLKNFLAAFDLLNNLPAGINVNAITYSNQGWSVQGSLTAMSLLSALNQKLIALQWLNPQMGVDVSSQDGRYVWQFLSQRGAHDQ